MKKVGLFIVGLVCQVTVFSQKQFDIGLLTQSNSTNLSFEIRKGINEKYKHRLAVGVGSYPLYLTKEYHQIVDENLNSQYVTRIDEWVDMRYGVERKLKESVFSFGADLIVGYKSNKETVFVGSKKIEENGMVEDIYRQISEPFDASKTSYLLKTGIRTTFSADIQLPKSFILNLNFSPSFVSYRLSNSKLNGEDLDRVMGEFSNFNGILSSLDSNIGIGIRYQFQKK